MTEDALVLEKLTALVASGAGRPVLFVGSGLSRRYLGLDDWSDLLSRFSVGLSRPFEYYVAKAGKDLPAAAELMADEFNEVWWKEDAYAESREEFKSVVGSISDPLKIEVSKFLSGIDVGQLDDGLRAEIELLRKTSAAAIITTNWDCFLESLFPQYQVFVGQSEAIARRLHGVGEIYKIHGSCTKPLSLVMTTSDYKGYSEKNPYLAAKLLSLFLEHPVFFVGYSVSDPNIKQILSRVAYCLDEETRLSVGRRIAIVRWSPGEPAEVRTRDLELDSNVRMTVSEVVLPEFSELFATIGEAENTIDAGLLRKIKDHLYQIVVSADPKERISVISPEDLDSRSDVEFVVGVGVQSELAARGVVGLQRMDLLKDLANREFKFDSIAKELVQTGIPAMRRGGAKTIPVGRYLQAAGYLDDQKRLVGDVPSAVGQLFRLERSDFEDASYRYRKDEFSRKSLAEVLRDNPIERAVVFMTLMDISAEDLGDFVHENAALLEHESQQTRDCFAKLICVWDRKSTGIWS